MIEVLRLKQRNPRSRTAPDAVHAPALLTIGQVAAGAQISTDSVRFYEREGLLAPKQRSGSGYRLYSDDALRRLSFIRHAQQCGFSLAEIRELLEMRGDDKSCCDDIYRVALEKKLRLEAKIKALKAMSQALGGLIEACSRDEKPLDACPILSALESSIAQRGAR
ncbi:MAG: heavy metal-responsive transcriptional regulator [Burkholderiales bacterium]